MASQSHPRKRRCKCNPGCFKMLSRKTRNNHYSRTNANLMEPSSSGSKSDEPTSHSNEADDALTQDNEADDEPTMPEASESLQSSDSESDVLLPFDHSDNIQHSVFHDEDFNEDLFPTLEEIEEQLAAWTRPEIEEDFHSIRESTPIQIYTCAITIAINIGDRILTEQDRDNICAFQLKLSSHMPRRMYDTMRTAFSHKISIDSEWIILRRLALLSGIEPRAIDCCVNSCIAYTREHSLREDCPYCNEARFNSTRQPRRTFSYLPLIPRLQAFFQNEAMINLLRYRSELESQATVISDVFD
ncbi:hypothetical protein P692DRAFT_201712128 [Suillus brevipes Sb2]|nr:hypothetical protein P692DRAFT_201712128 [Suillus brevipes Sb2]